VLFGGREAVMLATPEMDRCAAAIAHLTWGFGDRVWLVFKCDPNLQAHTLHWLTADDFCRRTRVPDRHVLFVTGRPAVAPIRKPACSAA
jgi:hypothetical protein